jgi:hypothetical protein
MCLSDNELGKYRQFGRYFATTGDTLRWFSAIDGPRKGGFVKKTKIANLEEIRLELVSDDDRYTHKTFRINLLTGSGDMNVIDLDGIQLGDLLADAEKLGMPVAFNPPEQFRGLHA